MMIRKILLLTIVATMLFPSCDSLLEEDPQYSINSQTVFSDPVSAQLALNACYGYLAGYHMYGQTLVAVTEFGAGLGHAPNVGAGLIRYSSFDFDPTEFWTGFFWNGVYKTISETNSYIVNVENSTLENKEYLAAQAKFIRAIAYYNLAFTYGGVPLRITPSNSENIHLPRSTKEEVLNQVVLDLTSAAEKFNDTEEDTSVPSKVAAYAMLAKLYFLQSKWQEAKSWGDKVLEIVGAEPPLEPVFGDLFDINNTNSVESIFKLNYSITGNTINKNSWMYSARNSTLSGINWAASRCSKPFFNYFSQQHPGDPRIDASYFHTSYTNVKAGWDHTIYPAVNAAGNYWSYPCFKKHTDPRQVGQHGAKTQYIYRFADFILLLADVENELGNKNKAVEYVNRVLKRARESVSPAATEPQDVAADISTEELKQVIFDERLFELTQEGHSFMEVRRRGYEFLKQIIDRHNSDPSCFFDNPDRWTDNRIIDSEKMWLIAIPQSEINSNSEINDADQNPGYN